MKYIKYTYVDAKTEICIDKEPAKNGPKHPNIKGLKFVFAAERKYPTKVPEFFGVCDDDADLNIDGFFNELSESEFVAEREEEILARKPYNSWIVNNLVWNDWCSYIANAWLPPMPRPEDGQAYTWNEESNRWDAVTLEAQPS